MAPKHSDNYELLEIGAEINPELYYVDTLVDPPVLALKPAPGPVPATWNDTKTFRQSFECLPITTPHGTIQVCSPSLARLEHAVENFMVLDTLVGGKLGWKMADNSIVLFTLLELTALLNEATTLKAKRAALLHAKAEELRVMDPPPTLAFISDFNNWIT